MRNTELQLQLLTTNHTLIIFGIVTTTSHINLTPYSTVPMLCYLLTSSNTFQSTCMTGHLTHDVYLFLP